MATSTSVITTNLHIRKYLLFLCTAVLLGAQACSSTSKLPPAQTSLEFYDKYRNQPGFKGNSIPVGLAARLIGSQLDDSTKAMLQGIRSVRMLTYAPENNKGQRFLTNSLLPEIQNVFKTPSYSSLPLNGPAGLELRVKEEQEKVKELAVFGQRSNGFLLLLVEGNMDQRMIQKVLQKIDPDLVAKDL
ncbi:DUF4252 domain-containing protein [Nibribacter ruber]|uniref:DUF4252 domain-containing protein n=1 Tax=Nibribacter ruber TaxID=2698458 RepID=A0A6P1NXL1_9BACT|nr:DUF4252 domain-containing protein [Nibribacter ruber]QHL88427.1 DUF4252 domain-containing protein [Nibribacter ruber]